MDSLMRYISRVSRLGYLYRCEKLKEYNLNGMHHTYIFALCKEPGIDQETLAGRVFVNKSNVARHLLVLEENGYITREKSTKDKRRLLVYPTKKAYDVVPVLTGILKEWNAAILTDFSTEEQLILLAAMEKIMEKARGVLNQTEKKSR